MALTPTAGASTPRLDLVGAYNQFDPPLNGCVARLVLPNFDVSARAGRFGVVPRKVHLGLVNTKRAAKADASRSDWTPDSDSFSILEYTHESMADFQEMDLYKAWFDLEAIETARCARVIETDIEKDAADAVFNDTTFPADNVTGATVGTSWATAATATPVDDIMTGVNAIMQNWGVMPNALIIPFQTYLKVCATTDVKNRITNSGTAPGLISDQQMRDILGLPPDFQIIKPWAVYNSANPSTASPTGTAIWSKNRALITRIERTMDLQVPQLGRQFARNDMGMGGSLVESFPYKNKGVIINATRHVQNKIMPSAPGYMLRGINP